MDGNRLRQFRNLLGFSQKEFAEKIGLTRIVVNMMENDKKPVIPSAETAVFCLMYEEGIKSIGGRSNLKTDDED